MSDANREIEQINEKIEQYNKKSIETLKQCVGSTEQSKEIGAATLSELATQNEKLGRIDKHCDDIDVNLNKSDR